MSEGVYITRTEWNQISKQITFMQQWILNNSKPRLQHKELNEAEAMELIGCKKTKLDELRRKQELDWRYVTINKTTGSGSGIRIKRQSVEDYIENMYLETSSLETPFKLKKAA
ncbi:hypothetical protein [Segetibacter aerophilus]|uniref:Helix-turn-helix domain-containing protein n=1 Tax=Segetibacter aerophilus TaxID=670293 RepID=A0A512BI76_9BACT|nr:hypothetical protein [Segetibacter aerophilus]GEO11527.1 hypothetical protein SAE01_40230 [Segetibacter aerophilus]